MDCFQSKFYKLWSIRLKALSPDRVTGKQIEAARVALTRHMKTRKSLDRIFPNIPVSKTHRRIHGKLKPEYYTCKVKPGRILFEVDGVLETVKEVLCFTKLPIKTNTIKRFA